VSTLIAALASAGALLASSCSTLPPNYAEIRRTTEDRLYAHVQIGAIVEISTPVALTAGYQWIVMVAAGSPIHLEDTSVRDSDSALLGAPATYLVRYRVAASGCTRLDFRMVRSNNPDEVPEDLFVVVISSGLSDGRPSVACGKPA
jgi:predicted secreted protein